MDIARGTVAKTPKGFHTSVEVMGRKLRIRYYRSLRRGKDSLEGYLNGPKEEIWVATHGRTPDTIADSIWHEVHHWACAYHVREHGKDPWPIEMEEAMISMFELADSTLLKNNRWYWEKYRPENGSA